MQLKNKKTLITVIIPFYNEERHLEQCLQTLKSQIYPYVQFIGVDDGSTDGSSKIAAKYVDILLEQRHKGPGSAKNKAAQIANGKILIFADADMYFDKNFIKKLIEPILREKTYATFTNDEYIANSDNIWVKCSNIDNGIVQGKRYKKTKNSLVPRAIRKDLFLKLGGMNTNLGYRDDNIFLSTNFRSLAADGAICYHYNPDNLKEIYEQAKWIGKNPVISNFYINLLRYSLLNSLIISIHQIINGAPLYFLIYKIVFDFGIFTGILSLRLTKNYAK